LTVIKLLRAQGTERGRWEYWFMTEADVARYRREAEECRRRAAKTVDPVQKDSWHRMADEWLKLAQEAQDRGQ